mgnify:CR=1 FL=1
MKNVDLFVIVKILEIHTIGQVIFHLIGKKRGDFFSLDFTLAI